jgi:hypothetical protein
MLYGGAAAATGLGVMMTTASLTFLVKGNSALSNPALSNEGAAVLFRRGQELGLVASGLFITAAVSAGVGYFKARQKKASVDAAASPAGAPAVGGF